MKNGAKRPLIGVTLDAEIPGGYSKFPWYAARENYFSAIAAAGGALVAMEGGHGQWFVQPFAADLSPRADIRSLLPDEAAALTEALIVGNRAEQFVARRGSGRALATLPDARAFLRLPSAALLDQPSPIYGRAPDAKPMTPA